MKERLLAIRGRGIAAREDGDDVVVCWSAKVVSAGVAGADYEYLYRAIRVAFDPDAKTVRGICLSTATEGELDGHGLSVSGSWRRGQQVGAEQFHVLAWLGPHRTEGGAGEDGYRFSWSLLRDPVIAAATKAGWNASVSTMQG